MFTNGFSAQNILGEGGFGPVYKGQLPNGRLVAVKQLKVGGSQGEREFRAEVEIISRVHHRHLVSLVGYCISEHQKLLVYDYVPNNTLHYHLHGIHTSPFFFVAFIFLNNDFDTTEICIIRKRNASYGLGNQSKGCSWGSSRNSIPA